MKKRILSLVLSLAMVLTLMPMSAFAEDGEIALEGNLLKITTTGDFEAGTLENLEIVSDIGNGAVVLADGATEGTYISPVYATDTWVEGVASWSASIQDGSQIEVWARARIDGEWTQFLTWGAYSPFISRGSTDNKTDALAKVKTDEFSVLDGVADAVQMMVVLSRDSADITSPEVRQIAMSFEGGEMEVVYAEETVEIPAKAFNPAPGYRQSGRSSIGGSMCSPTTASVLLNSRDPDLQLIPEALANTNEDNSASSYSFGNWAFSASAPGLFGYECYMQFTNKDILLQELAQGRTVGISVEYGTTEGGSYPYLENAYSNTGGHLISIVGYEYEDEIMDDEHLYFISSDSYAGSDSDVYRRYKWTQLDECWNNRVTYMIPSLTPETNATTESIVREHGELVQDENDSTLFTMVDADGNELDLLNAARGSRTIYAYTVEGFKSEPAADTEHSIAYEEAFQVEANNTFTYSGVELNDDGQLVFNATSALTAMGVGRNDPRTVTIYVMGNQGYIYSASAVFEIAPDKTVVVTPAGSSMVTSEKNGQVLATLNVDNLDGDLTVGVLIPADADVESAAVTVDGEAAEILGVYTDENDVDYAVIKLDPSKTEQTVVANWGETSDTYIYDLKDVIVLDDLVTVESGNVVKIDAATGVATEELAIGSDGTISLKKGETEGVYTSPVYDSFDWEYAMGFLGAYAPKGSAVDLQMRAFSERNQIWSSWLSLGSAGDDSTSVKVTETDVNMDTDVFTMRGSSSVANAQRFQLRLVLTSEDGTVQPTVFNAGVTYKKSAYDADEAEPLKEIAELPASAGILDAPGYSAYAYGKLSSWRFENMELIMLNAQGADLLFEEVAFANYDHRSGWGNWAMTNFKPGAFGYDAYTQFGASSELIQQALAAGNMVGLYVRGNLVPGTNSANTSQTVVVGYYTADDGTVMFKLICPRGDTGELADGDVYGEISAADLDAAIVGFNSASARGLMYVVGSKVFDTSWARIEAEAEMTNEDNTAFTVSVDGDELELDSDFISEYTTTDGGIVAYTLSSATDADAKLAAGKFYYDIQINNDGTFTVPAALKDELYAGGTAQIYIICNDGETYVATLEHTHDWEDAVTKVPTSNHSGEITHTCVHCGETYTTKIPATNITPANPTVEDKPVVEEPVEMSFTDVKENAWFYGDVRYVFENELMNGVGNGTKFAPDMDITRGMIVTILWRMEGQPAPKAACQFADVSAGAYYEDAIAWAAENGIVTGFSATKFNPDASITREQFAAILYRYAQFKDYDVSVGEETNILSYDDALTIGEYAIPAMQWACGAGLINGTGSNLNPTGNATRAQAAAILHRFCENVQ